MDNTELFIKFLDNLESATGNQALIEAVKKGFILTEGPYNVKLRRAARERAKQEEEERNKSFGSKVWDVLNKPISLKKRDDDEDSSDDNPDNDGFRMYW